MHGIPTGNSQPWNNSLAINQLAFISSLSVHLFYSVQLLLPNYTILMVISNDNLNACLFNTHYSCNMEYLLISPHTSCALFMCLKHCISSTARIYQVEYPLHLYPGSHILS